MRLCIVLTILGSSAMSLAIPPVRESSTLPNTPFYATLAARSRAKSYTRLTFGGPEYETSMAIPSHLRELAFSQNGYGFGMGSSEAYRVQLDPPTATELIPSGVPTIAWGMGITYDPTRDVFYLATLVGEGFLYRFSPHDEQWSVLTSLNFMDLTAIAFDPITDRIYSIGRVSSANLLGEYSPIDGSLIRQRPVDLLLFDFNDRFNQLHVVDDYLAFTQPLRPTPDGQATVLIQAIEISSAKSWIVTRSAIPEVPAPSLLLLAGVVFGVARAVRYR